MIESGFLTPTGSSIRSFVSLISFRKTSGAGSFAVGTNTLAAINDYVLWFAKDLGRLKYHQVYRPKEMGGPGSEQ